MRITKMLLGLVALGAIAAWAGAAALGRSGPSDTLWQAIVAVESGGDTDAFNPHDGATGVAQIRTVCVSDINRIARLRGAGERFTASDRYSPHAARRMWHLYLGYYGEQYEKETGQAPTDEVYARIWNGGPSGWRKQSTLAYWHRVHAALREIA